MFSTTHVISFVNWICQSSINGDKTAIGVITPRKRPGGTAAVLAYGSVSANTHTHLE